ncbi:PQQ-like beta-propeller repeat protein [Caldithrix abyssi]|nr:PQQ-like beta-propeller repeat protein [Caldithrix abyssi]
MDIRKDIFIFIIMILGSYSCDEPPPDTIPPTMLQEHTPWPSLADSPWPMFRGNPHNTGRSEYVGPKTGTIKWEFQYDPKFVYSGGSSVSLDAEGNIYFLTHNGYLYSVDPQGKQRWRKSIISGETTDTEIFTAPTLTADGTIYAPSFDNNLYAFNTDGELLWKKEMERYLYWTDGLFLDKEGNIYSGVGNNLIKKMNNKGEKIWSFPVTGFSSSLIFFPKGDLIAIPGESNFVINLNGNVGWYNQYPTWGLPLIDSQNNLYYSHSDTLFSLNEKGDFRWQLPLSDHGYGRVGYFMTMNKWGEIYLSATQLSTNKNFILQIAYNGEINWEVSSYVYHDFVCDSEGNLYFSHPLIEGRESVIVCLDRSGYTIFKTEPIDGIIANSPAIGADGTIYYTMITQPNKLVAIQ